MAESGRRRDRGLHNRQDMSSILKDYVIVAQSVLSTGQIYGAFCGLAGGRCRIYPRMTTYIGQIEHVKYFVK